MRIWEIVLVGLGLSMDAMAVTLSNSMSFTGLSRAKQLAMPLFFGLFQALMPLAGFFLGSLFAGYITQYSGIVVFIILGFIGGKMLRDAFVNMRLQRSDRGEALSSLTYKLLLTQALATSIDAFAVGIGLSAAGAGIYLSVCIIGVTTFAVCGGALVAGKYFGKLLGNKAEILGGAILIFIAIKALFS